MYTVTVTHKRDLGVIERALDWAIDASRRDPDNFGRRFYDFVSDPATRSVTFQAAKRSDVEYVLRDSFGYAPRPFAIKIGIVDHQEFSNYDDWRRAKMTTAKHKETQDVEPEEYRADPRWQNLVDALEALKIPASLITDEMWPGVCIGAYDTRDSMSPILVAEGQLFVEPGYLFPGPGDDELQLLDHSDDPS